MTITAEYPRTADNLQLIRLLTKVYSQPITVCNAVGTVWILAIMLMIVANILGLQMFGTPIRGVILIVSHSIVGIVFLQMASSLEVGRITRTSVFIGRLLKTRPFAAAVYQLIFHALGAAVLAVIAYRTWPNLVDAWQTGEWEGSLTDVMMPVWPIKAIIVLGAAATSLQFVRLALRDVAVLVTGVPQESTAPVDAPRGWVPIIVMAFGILAVALLALNAEHFSNLQIGIMSVGAMLLMIYSGMHIAIALFVLSFGGMSVILGSPDLAITFLARTSNNALTNFTFGVVPLFVLTGLLVSAAEFGREAFEVAEWMFGRIVGGLGVATVAANAVFAAITGVSLASAAVFTRVAVPPMVERGFTTKFAVGIVAGSSVLGMLIPPSLLLIIYGLVTEVSVGRLFVAAVIPGIILSTAFGVMIILLARLMPNFVGIEPAEKKAARLAATLDGDRDPMVQVGHEFVTTMNAVFVRGQAAQKTWRMKVMYLLVALLPFLALASFWYQPLNIINFFIEIGIDNLLYRSILMIPGFFVGIANLLDVIATMSGPAIVVLVAVEAMVVLIGGSRLAYRVNLFVLPIVAAVFVWSLFAGGNTTSLLHEILLGVAVFVIGGIYLGKARFLGGVIKMVPILALMLIVLGGIYGGVFSPTEAGAAGAFAAIVIAVLKRRLTWRLFWDVMQQTGHISTGVLFLIMASMFYGQMLAFSGLPAFIMSFVTDAGYGLIGLILAYMVVLLILGMILDPISIILITVPMIYLAVEQGGGNLVWFGVITIIAVEAGLLTPPLGLTVFVVQGIMGDDKVSVPDVFKGAFPFVITMVLVLVLLISQECTSLVLLEHEGAACREVLSGWRDSLFGWMG